MGAAYRRKLVPTKLSAFSVVQYSYYVTTSSLWQSLVQAFEVHYKAVSVSIASENQRSPKQRGVHFWRRHYSRPVTVGAGSRTAAGLELSKLDLGGVEGEGSKVGESIHEVTWVIILFRAHSLFAYINFRDQEYTHKRKRRNWRTAKFVHIYDYIYIKEFSDIEVFEACWIGLHTSPTINLTFWLETQMYVLFAT